MKESDLCWTQYIKQCLELKKVEWTAKARRVPTVNLNSTHIIQAPYRSRRQIYNLALQENRFW